MKTPLLTCYDGNVVDERKRELYYIFHLMFGY